MKMFNILHSTYYPLNGHPLFVTRIPCSEDLYDDERKEPDTLVILEIEWKEPQNLNCPSLNSWRVHSWMVTASNNTTETKIIC